MVVDGVSRLQVWHNQFGHAHQNALREMARLQVVKGMTLSSVNFATPLNCLTCLNAKGNICNTTTLIQVALQLRRDGPCVCWRRKDSKWNWLCFTHCRRGYPSKVDLFEVNFF